MRSASVTIEITRSAMIVYSGDVAMERRVGSMMDTPSDSHATPTPPIEALAPATTKRSHRARWIVIPLIVVLVVTAAGFAYHFYGKALHTLTQTCAPSHAVRHTLPCDIPLLKDATYKGHSTNTLQNGASLNEWDYTTPESLDQLVSYYQKAFSADGWSCVGDTVLGDLIAVAATGKSGRPNSVAAMAFQINVPMSPNEFGVILVDHGDAKSILPESFKCGRF